MSDEDHEHIPSRLEIAEQAMLVVNAELITAVATGTTPSMASVLAVAGAGVLARFKAKGEKHVTAISEDVGPERFHEVLETDPEREALFINSLQIAMLTADDQKRIYLARVVANAFKDDALVDDAILITEALRALDGPHIKTLAQIAAVDQKLRSHPLPTNNDDWQRELERHREPILAALVRAGVVYAGLEEDGDGNYIPGLAKTYGISGVNQFGRDLLAELESVDVDVDVDVA